MFQTCANPPPQQQQQKISAVEYSALFRDEYANAMGMMYEGRSEFLFELDRAAQAFVPPVAASEVFAGRVVADGNCFFRAVSLRVFGTQVQVSFVTCKELFFVVHLENTATHTQVICVGNLNCRCCICTFAFLSLHSCSWRGGCIRQG